MVHSNVCLHFRGPGAVRGTALLGDLYKISLSSGIEDLPWLYSGNDHSQQTRNCFINVQSLRQWSILMFADMLEVLRLLEAQYFYETSTKPPYPLECEDLLWLCSSNDHSQQTELVLLVMSIHCQYHNTQG